MKKIFITGGAGYVGSALTDYLIDNGYYVTVYDLFIYGQKVFKSKKNLELIKGDLRDEKLLNNSIKDHESVIHLACISNDPSFELNPSLGKSINFDSFEPFLKICLKKNIKRFIYASSSSVYGIKKEKDVTEDMTLEPLTDYSKFKVECENILMKEKSKNFETVVIRPATVCGYSMRQRLDVIVNILTNLAYHKREISVFGGKQLRPNIHIKDMIKAYHLLIKADAELVNGEIFNAGWENKSVEQITEIVRNVIGKDVRILKSKTNDNRSYHISSKKIQKLLKFDTDFTIKDAVEDLKSAFEKKILTNTFDSDFFFNIKRMNNINLK